MTTANKNILAALLTNTELAQHEDFIREILETKSGTREVKNPEYTDETTGIEMKWCVRHEQYEPKSAWNVQKRPEASCHDAILHWRLLTKELKQMTAELLETGDDDLRLATKAKSEERSGRYTPEFTTAELLAQATPSKPTRTKK